MKGLILAGGLGTKLRPMTYSQQKQLIPIANRPMLFYCIEDLIRSGVETIGIVVGPNKEQVIAAVKSVPWGADIHFVHQRVPGGLAHAVKEARPFIGNDQFIMYLGDNLIRGGSTNFVRDFAESKVAASLLLTTTQFPERYGMALVDEQKKVVTKVVEKPENPESNLIVVGIYGLSPLIFEAIDNIRPSWRNELEITDALSWLINNGYSVRYAMVDGWWKDTGRAEDIVEANCLVLDSLEPKNDGKVEDSAIKGRVSIGKNTVVRNGSTIKGPAIIGEGCVISGSCIGPYASIGDRCQVTDSEVADSIVMDGTVITSAGRILESLIGKDVRIERNLNSPLGGKFVLGDNSEVKM